MIERGDGKGTSVPLDAARGCVVGRDNPQSALPLKDPMASRNHFEIRPENGSWLIQDMKSRNGTLLNDERLGAAAVPLRIGDKIQVGETILSLLSDEKEESTGGLVGKVLGGYRIQERLGRGGMGTVYKAEQLSLHRVVALKVLSAKLLSDASFVEKFIAEARAAGQLNHPNIVQVFDVGSDRGVHFFSMELMEPESVGDVVAREGPVPWARALDMMTDAAKGLIYAEKRGIVHRDIKPDNLMLTAEGTVKIGDLGLAKRAEDAPVEGGAIFGTPHFIAPEQAQGKPIDNRADIYSLGATFYRILSGKTPFTGENVKEILVKQIHEEPPPLRKLVADLPEEMVLVIEKMMKKRADDRYRSAQGLLEDLERVRIRYHLEAHGVSASAKRSKIIAAVLAVVVVALGVVAYEAINRPETVRTVTVGNGDRPPPVDPQPRVVTKTPAERADEAFRPVQTADLEFSLKAGGKDPLETNTWKTLGAGWEDIAERYAAMAAAHQGTGPAKTASDRAAYIRRRIEEARAEEERRGTEAEAAWTALRASVQAAIDAGRTGDALAELAKSVKALREKHGEYLPQGTEKTSKDLREKAVADADARVRALATELERASGVHPGDDFAAALARLKELEATLRPADGSAVAEVEDRIAQLDRARKTAEAKARAVVDQMLLADAATWAHGYLEIRRFAAEDAAPDAASTPFFDFRWDEAITRWEALHGKLRVTWYRDRATEKIEHYRRCKAVFETVVAKINAGEFRDPGFPADVRRGAAAVILDRSSTAKPATLEGCSITRQIGGSRQKERLEFRRMTPREFFVDFLKEAADLDPGGAGHLDLAVFLAEAGEGLLAVGQMGAAGRARDPSPPGGRLKEWLEGEIRAYTEHAGPGGIVEQFGEYERALQGSAPARAADLLRQKLLARIDAFLASPEFRRTDYYLLHHSSLLGPAGSRFPLVLPAGLREATLASYGLAAEAATVPVDEDGTGAGPTNGGTGDGEPGDKGTKDEGVRGTDGPDGGGTGEGGGRSGGGESGPPPVTPPAGDPPPRMREGDE